MRGVFTWLLPGVMPTQQKIPFTVKAAHVPGVLWLVCEVQSPCTCLCMEVFLLSLPPLLSFLSFLVSPIPHWTAKKKLYTESPAEGTAASACGAAASAPAVRHSLSFPACPSFPACHSQQRQGAAEGGPSSRAFVRSVARRSAPRVQGTGSSLVLLLLFGCLPLSCRHPPSSPALWLLQGR